MLNFHAQEFPKCDSTSHFKVCYQQKHIFFTNFQRLLTHLSSQTDIITVPSLYRAELGFLYKSCHGSCLLLGKKIRIRVTF